MYEQSSVSTWLLRLQGRPDEVAAQKLWEYCSPRLQGIARRLILRFGLDATFDEDDATSCVFAELCLGLHRQQFPQLLDSQGLWRLLARMTVRKVRDYSKRQQALKRNNGAELAGTTALLDCLPNQRPEPSVEVLMMDQCQLMLRQLNDPILEQVVLMKLDGYTNHEIAERLQYSRRSIQRMLNLVKDLWGHYAGE